MCVHLFWIIFCFIGRMPPSVGLAIINYSDPSLKDMAGSWEMVSDIGYAINSCTSFIYVLNFLMRIVHAMYGAISSDVCIHLFFFSLKGYIQKWNEGKGSSLSGVVIRFE